MPKEVFNDAFGGGDGGNTLVVKWGEFGYVEVATLSPGSFTYPFAAEGDENAESMRGWYLTLSRDELQRLVKVLTRAARTYDDVSELGEFAVVDEEVVDG